jgi:hypothetical protein
MDHLRFSAPLEMDPETRNFVPVAGDASTEADIGTLEDLLTDGAQLI